MSPVRAGPVRDEKDGRYTVIALSRATCPPDHVKGPWWEYAGRTVKLPKPQMGFRNVLLTTFCYHLAGDGSDGDDCRGGMR